MAPGSAFDDDALTGTNLRSLAWTKNCTALATPTGPLPVATSTGDFLLGVVVNIKTPTSGRVSLLLIIENLIVFQTQRQVERLQGWLLFWGANDEQPLRGSGFGYVFVNFIQGFDDAGIHAAEFG
jgi:hypothetical protein